MADGFTRFLERSLDELADAWPVGSARLAERLDARVVSMRVGDDACRITGGSHRAIVRRGAGAADIALRTDRACILALADGEVSLLDAVLGARLDLRGRIDDLTRFDEALNLYLHGAARTAAFPGLLEDYRRGSSA